MTGAETLFLYLFILSAVGLAVAVVVTRRPSHRQRHS